MMRVPYRILALGVLAVSLLAGCASGPSIHVDADPGANIAGFRTYGYFEPLATDKAGYSTILTARLKAATKRELEARGFTYAATDPDLLVNFNVNVVEKTEVRSSPNVGVGYGYYGYRAGMYGAWSGYPYDVETTNYKQGTLSVDVVEAKRKALVWQGVAEGRISQEAQENPAAAIDGAVAQVMASFPSRVAPAPAAR